MGSISSSTASSGPGARRKVMDVLVAVLTVVALGAVELWAAVPAGFALGLHPVATAVAAAVGATVASVVVLVAGGRLRAKLTHGRSQADNPDSAIGRIWRRYGVIGLGLAAPLLVGAPAGTAIGVALGAPPDRLLRWMIIGIVAWSAILAVAGALGLAVFEAAT